MENNIAIIIIMIINFKSKLLGLILADLVFISSVFAFFILSFKIGYPDICIVISIVGGRLIFLKFLQFSNAALDISVTVDGILFFLSHTNALGPISVIFFGTLTSI